MACRFHGIDKPEKVQVLTMNPLAIWFLTK